MRNQAYYITITKSSQSQTETTLSKAWFSMHTQSHNNLLIVLLQVSHDMLFLLFTEECLITVNLGDMYIASEDGALQEYKVPHR